MEEACTIEVRPVRVLAPVTPSVPMTDKFPAESKVEVAVAPKYAVPITDNLVDDACTIEVRPVRVLAPVTERVPSV